MIREQKLHDMGKIVLAVIVLALVMITGASIGDTWQFRDDKPPGTYPLAYIPPRKPVINRLAVVTREMKAPKVTYRIDMPVSFDKRRTNAGLMQVAERAVRQ